MLQKNKKVEELLSDEEIKCTRWKECKAKITYAMLSPR
jgi:transcription antitermination factor NusA-like protein